MKKYSLLFITAATSLMLTYCGSSKKATATKVVPKSTYALAVSTVIMNNCAPCHIPAKGGNKKPYDNFANVKTDIDDIIRRIEMNPTDRGFMPFKKNAKLSDSTIAVFKQWKADGLLEN
jgi:mono/diheme cytochrome c family protein